MSITFPYRRTTDTFTAEQIKAWRSVTLGSDAAQHLRGMAMAVSPPLGKFRHERHHHTIKVTVEGEPDETTCIAMGRAARPEHEDRIFTTSHYTQQFPRLGPGVHEIDYEADRGWENINWWLIEQKPGIRVVRIEHTYWQCPDDQTTNWLYTPIQTLEYMGGRMHYAIAYPPNYDSTQDVKYPLVFSVGGSGEAGDDQRFINSVDSGALICKNHRNYTELPSIYVSIQIPWSGATPTAGTFTDPIVPPKLEQPYDSGWSNLYSGASYGAHGMIRLLRQLLADPDHQIDEDRVYLAGMSGGGLFAFNMMLGMGRDVLAATAPISAWPIGQPYQHVQANRHWLTPPEGKQDSLRDRLKKKVLRATHIPTLVGVGDKDGMVYGSRAYKEVADEIGVPCRYVEIENGKHAWSVKRVWADHENLKWLLSHRRQKPTPPDPFPGDDYTIPLKTREAQMIRLTAEDNGYYFVTLDGVDHSQHVTEREAIESAVNLQAMFPNTNVQYEHRYKTSVDCRTVTIQDPPTTEG